MKYLLQRMACILLVGAAVTINAANEPPKPVMTEIVRRVGDKLYEGEKEFRFLGLAAPNLQANENQLRPDFSNRFPDEYEIRDLLGALQQLGARATRTFALSVYSPKDGGAPVYISGHREYNEEAFQCLDRILALAHEYDVRIILPFIASQSFPTIRGVDEFAHLSGKPGPFFWIDPGIKADFKHFLSFVLNRKNTVTGLLYKDDPAILAWQLGNEFGSYSGDRRMDYGIWEPVILDWTREMAAYIKEVDPNHLVAEAGGCSREALIADPNIDIISDHLYEYWNRMAGRSTDLAALACESWNECKGRKVLLVDEFGLGSTDNVVSLMDAIIDSGISGGLLWSIRSHRRDGGWYYHNEGGTPINSYHFPGFSNGHTYEATRMLELLRQRAFTIRGISLSPISAPEPTPVLMKNEAGFTWRGSLGASSYEIQRATGERGEWQTVAIGLEDSVIADAATLEASQESAFPLTLWYDASAKSGDVFSYRIRGVNVSGNTEWSDAVTVAY